MNMQNISLLISSYCNNAEVIAPEVASSLNVAMAEMPDVLAYDKSLNRLYVINATSIETKNTNAYVEAMESQFSKCQLERVYIFVYQSRAEYGKKAKELVWGTHIWCVDEPGHMIHLNGDKFLGPR